MPAPMDTAMETATAIVMETACLSPPWRLRRSCRSFPGKGAIMAIGSFCLVLHSHLPYVLRHGSWPHGEDWLYEAAAETYLPLLATLDECLFLNARPRITIGLTPVLLEQLAHGDFKDG